jgi:hypothetical protein
VPWRVASLVERAGVDRHRKAVEPAACASSTARRLVDDRADVGGRSAGSPMRSSCMAPASISLTRSAMSVWTNSTRSAEQRCPAELKAEATTSRTICSGSADESAISAFWPPVSAISGTSGPVLAGQRAGDDARHLGRAGEGDAGTLASGDQRRADAAVAGQEGERSRRDAGAVQQLDRERGDQRRLLGRLGDAPCCRRRAPRRPGRRRSPAGNSTG